MVRTVLASLTLAAAFAGAPAFADSVLVAQLQSPLSAPTKVVAGGAAWRCEASACRAEATSDRTLTIDACRALAKAVGPVTSYGDGFDAARLAKCDAGLPGAAPVLAKAAAPHAGGF